MAIPRTPTIKTLLLCLLIFNLAHQARSQIVLIQGSDTVSSSRTVINNNFTYLDNTKKTGTVTSVTFTGGLISIATPTTIPAFTVAGTSGGIPYFSSSSTWASSGALGANLPLFGGGAGASPIAGTRTGNTTQLATWTGATTSARCVHTDASGNLTISAADCGVSAGTVTVVGGGSLTSTALVTGGGTTTLQTPSATATMDTSGNISTPGSISTGQASGVAGYSAYSQGTATTAPTTSVGWMAPTSVSTPFMYILPGAPTTGFLLSTGTSDPTTVTHIGFTGTSNVVRSAGPTLSGTTTVADLTISGTCSGCGSGATLTTSGLGYTVLPFESSKVATTTTWNNNKASPYYTQFVLKSTAKVTSIRMYMTTSAAGAGDGMALALYDSTCTKVTNGDATSQIPNGATNSTRTWAFSSPPTLSPGVYFYGFATENTATVFYQQDSTTLFDLLTNESNTLSRTFTGANAATSTGASLAMPGTCGAKTISTAPPLYGFILP